MDPFAEYDSLQTHAGSKSPANRGTYASAGPNPKKMKYDDYSSDSSSDSSDSSDDSSTCSSDSFTSSDSGNDATPIEKLHVL